MRRFPFMVIIRRRPTGNRPTIIDLPNQRAHTIRHIPTMCLDTHLCRKSLQHVGHVNKLFKLVRNPVIHFHIIQNTPVTNITPLVWFHHLRFYIIILRQCIRFYRTHLRKGLKPVFTAKTGCHLIKAFQWPETMPHTPIMLIPRSRPVQSMLIRFRSRHRWGRPVVISIRVILHHFGKYLVKNGIVSLENCILFLFRESVLPSPSPRRTVSPS